MTPSVRGVASDLATLVDRYDPAVFDHGRPSARVRLRGGDPDPVDVLLEGSTATLVPADTTRRADAVLTADAETWAVIAQDLRGGMEAFRAGRRRSPSCRRSRRWPTAIGRSPSTSRASATRTSRCARPTTPPTSRRR
jgi:hypothetical protein